MSTDIERLSYQRDMIYDYVCDRFKQLISEDRIDDSIAIADEFYEWLDQEQTDDEETLYYDEKELQELYFNICGNA
jgi:hypothetical protein